MRAMQPVFARSRACCSCATRLPMLAIPLVFAVLMLALLLSFESLPFREFLTCCQYLLRGRGCYTINVRYANACRTCFLSTAYHSVSACHAVSSWYGAVLAIPLVFPILMLAVLAVFPLRAIPSVPAILSVLSPCSPVIAWTFPKSALDFVSWTSVPWLHRFR